MNNRIANQPSTISCQLCGQPLHFISYSHLLFKHRMTTEQYKARFPNAPLKSNEYLAQYSNHSQIMKTRYFEGVVNPPVPTEEQKQKLSQRMRVNNPMKIKSIAKKVSKAKRGVSNEELQKRHQQREQEKEVTRLNRERVKVGMVFGR